MIKITYQDSQQWDLEIDAHYIEFDRDTVYFIHDVFDHWSKTIVSQFFSVKKEQIKSITSY